MEAAVTAARIAASEGRGAIFAPLAMGGAGGLRAGGTAADRLVRWLDGMETASRTAMRHLDDIEAWSARAETEMAPLSGRTPPALRAVLTEWPLVSAPMAESQTGANSLCHPCPCLAGVAAPCRDGLSISGHSGHGPHQWLITISRHCRSAS